MSSPFDRVEIMITNPDALSSIWRAARGLMDDEVVSVRIGAPDQQGLEELARQFEARFDRPFPAVLRAALERFNGLAIGASPARDTTPRAPEVVSPARLGEPQWWPASGYDRLALDGNGILEGAEPYLLGELPDSGWIVLAISDRGESEGAVCWIPSDVDSGATPLAGDLLQFFDRWCDAGLRIPSLLRNAKVRGWGG